jgi:hypothetical protein
VKSGTTDTRGKKKQNAKNRNSLQKKGAHALNLLLPLNLAGTIEFQSANEGFAGKGTTKRLTLLFSLTHTRTHTHNKKHHRILLSTDGKRDDDDEFEDSVLFRRPISIFLQNTRLILLDYRLIGLFSFASPQPPFFFDFHSKSSFFNLRNHDTVDFISRTCCINIHYICLCRQYSFLRRNSKMSSKSSLLFSYSPSFRIASDM